MSGVPPALSVSSRLRVKFGNTTQKGEPVTGSGRWKGSFSSVSALISVPCNRRAVPELPLTFLGWEFTCLVSAFRAQSKLACHFLSHHRQQHIYLRHEQRLTACYRETKDHHSQLGSSVPSYNGGVWRSRDGLHLWGDTWFAGSEVEWPEAWVPASGK